MRKYTHSSSWLWLILLDIMVSSCIHFPPNVIVSVFLKVSAENSGVPTSGFSKSGLCALHVTANPAKMKSRVG